VEMMENSYFFNKTANDPEESYVYQSEDFAKFYRQIIGTAGTGISNISGSPNLSIITVSNMTLAVQSGIAFINGYMYENTEDKQLTHDAAEPSYDRIDRIVLQLDVTAGGRFIKSVIKKGVPATSPVAPTLQRDQYIYEISLAQVRIIAGKSYIESSQITDERADKSVCGYITLHNILRGIDVNEDGIFSVINSPFLDTRNLNPWTAANNVHTKIPFGEATTNINTNYNEATSEITIEETGIYQFRIYISVNENTISTDSDIQVRSYVNGVDDRLLFAFVTANGGNNIFVNNGFKRYNKGEKVTFYVNAFRTGLTTITFNDAYITWAKIQ
jgi:hypothetical protein